MALCCIGGVCIPYTAIVPFLVLGLKWIFERLVAAGLVPAALQEKATAFLSASSSCSSSSSTCSSVAGNGTKLRRGKKTTNTACSDLSASSCCTTDSSTSSSKSSDKNGPSVIFVKSLNEWNSIVHNNNNNTTTVICKMTASWCKPCKVIQPIFEELANKNSSHSSDVIFCVVDVDELDKVAAKHRVTMLPTFLVMKKGEEVVDRYSGSNEQKLCELVAAALT